MGFHIEINSILRSDETYSLEREKEYPFRKDGSRIFFDDIPIWLTKGDWTALAEIRVTSQSRTPAGVEGAFRVLHVYDGEEQKALTFIFRRMYAGGGDPFLYLTLSPDDFARATAQGTWTPDSFKADGFIHASPADQLTRVANKHFKQFDEVRIVVLRADRIRPEIRWEPASDNRLYPHIYGPLNMAAAERSVTVKKGPDGLFSIPNPVA
jgi:uncharacterized protein (DUF952 family)